MMKLVRKKQKKSKFSKNKKILLFLMPSFCGLLIFYILPFIYGLYFAFFEKSSNTFVFFDNIKQVIQNQAFQQATSNTVIFMLIEVPINIILSFIIAYILQKNRYRKLLIFLFLIPFVIPSGTIMKFWHMLFDYHGLLNKILYYFGGTTPTYLFNGNASKYILTLIFLYKNLGFNIFLFSTGLRLIPKDYYEYAAIEGANSWNRFKYVTFSNILPTAFFTTVMAIVHSFNVFKEIFLLFGNYPNESIYMLQHYMNNQFIKMNFSNLTSASFLITLVMAMIISMFYVFQWKKTSYD